MASTQKTSNARPQRTPKFSGLEVRFGEYLHLLISRQGLKQFGSLVRRYSWILLALLSLLFGSMVNWQAAAHFFAAAHHPPLQPLPSNVELCEAASLAVETSRT